MRWSCSAFQAVGGQRGGIVAAGKAVNHVAEVGKRFEAVLVAGVRMRSPHVECPPRLSPAIKTQPAIAPRLHTRIKLNRPVYSCSAQNYHGLLASRVAVR